jgi:hypothetical protein
VDSIDFSRFIRIDLVGFSTVSVRRLHGERRPDGAAFPSQVLGASF